MTRRPVPLDRLQGLLGGETGLSEAEASERRERYGVNAIVEVPRGRWWGLVADTTRDPMLWFLGATGAVYAALGDVREAVTLLVALVPLAGMDAVLHWRSQASAEGLRSRLAERAVVVRDGRRREVSALDLVPGDLVDVTPGQVFPADGVIVDGTDLQADESILTGEAHPVVKRLWAGPGGPGPASLVEAVHWGFAGTRLLTGRARLRVAFTGTETIYGEIVRSAGQGRGARTPLQAAIQSLVGRLVVAAAVVCVVLAGVRLHQGYGWLDALVSAVTLAAAALPEEFPVVFTFFLGVGAYRLARRQALVRRAVSVENVGRVTVICSDKTGTITEGQLRLARLRPAPDLDERRLLRLARLASRPDSGDPLDLAIAAAAAQAAVGSEEVDAVATFPFTESRKRETVLIRDERGGLVAVTKGAAEVVLLLCDASDEERRRALAEVEALAGQAHKVLACAWRPVPPAAPLEEPVSGFRLAGLLAFEDPVRPGVVEAVRACREGGIHPIMVTGDHPLTARAVAVQVGLGRPSPRLMTGTELEALAREGTVPLPPVDVVARATPAQKLVLVRTLQRAGAVVAVTGDGVNDVPALQAADVGIAMGERGTRSAREAAAMVLLDDNFRTVVDAVREGRQLFANLRTSFQYLLMVHTPFVVSALAVPLLGYPLLFLPVHIVWIEMVIHPSALLVFQDRPRRRLEFGTGERRLTFFSRRDWLVIALSGTITTTAVLLAYVRSAGEPGGVEHGRAAALATLVLVSGVLASALSRLRTRVAWLVCLGTVASAVVLVQVPSLARLLHLGPLHVVDWLLAAAGALLAALPLGLGRGRSTPAGRNGCGAPTPHRGSAARRGVVRLPRNRARAAESAAWPPSCLRPHRREEARPMTPELARRILLATDFSEVAERAAAVARAYARALGAALHILHVAWPGDELAGRLLLGMEKDVGPDIAVTRAVEFGSPAARIVDYARRHQIDLIVVGTHGRTGVSRVLLGSVAERVIRTAPCPVLAVPLAALPSAEAPEAAAPERQRCLVCGGPSDDLICESCRARIRGEALERKQREERAGRG